MSRRDPRVDDYIEKAAEFARPILRHLRETVHVASSDIEETIKWGSPHFVHEGIVCSMASFKRHCAFGFWKERLLLKGMDLPTSEAMGQFGRITTIEDLPPREALIELVREAVRLNREGVKEPRATRGRDGAKDIPLHEDFRAALGRNGTAKAAFEDMSPSQRREYAEWIAEAKRDATRERRIATALEWIAQGKPKNWKYMK